jgi:uncharacterized membrane protein
MRASARILIVLATVIGFLAGFAVWVNRQALETDNWVDTSGKLLEDEEIQKAVSTFMVNELFTNVDVEQRLQQRLPPQAQALAGPATGGLRELADQLALRALQNPSVQQLWEDANRAAHQQLLDVINGGGSTVSTENGVVTLDLHALVAQLGTQVGIDVASKLPPDVGTIEILKSDQLSLAQDIADSIRPLAIALTLVALALYALAIYLSRDHRREAVRAAGLGFIAIGILLLITRSLAGHAVVNALASTEAVKPAVTNTWAIATSLLEGIGTAMIGYGVVIVLGAWLAGPSSLAMELRRGLTPGLRRRGIAYGGLALILLIVFWWNPTQGTSRLPTSVLLILLAVAGLEALRLQAVRDFPNETWDDASARWRERLAGVRGHAGADRGKAAAADTRVDQLERLARLRDSGVLSPEEFEREKGRLLAGE